MTKKSLITTWAVLAVSFLCRFCGAKDLTIEECQSSDGHKLAFKFASDISTNEPQYWELRKQMRDGLGLWATNYFTCSSNFYYFGEKPFPRTNTDSHAYEVYSNTYAFSVLDGETNQIAEKHVKLGDYKTSSVTIITASTNSVSTTTFTPAK